MCFQNWVCATGRWPRTADLGLEPLGVKMDGRAIAVNEYLQTNLPHVWAIGDAVGGMMLVKYLIGTASLFLHLL